MAERKSHETGCENISGQRGPATVSVGWARFLLRSDSVEFRRHFDAACGYAELGMERESLLELDAIHPAFQARPHVLQLRLHHYMKKRRWAPALRLSQQLCRVAPHCSAGFLHAGFCLHQLGRTAAARKLLIAGPKALLSEPIYFYNMGCYEALLGNVQNAKLHLQTSFKMDASFRALAKKDPDLKALQGTI